MVTSSASLDRFNSLVTVSSNVSVSSDVLGLGEEKEGVSENGSDNSTADPLVWSQLWVRGLREGSELWLPSRKTSVVAQTEACVT